MFGRAFQRDTWEFLVLSVLAEGARYGYAISKEVASRSENGVKLTPGVLYPLLARLERAGLITSRWEVVRSDRRPAAGIAGASEAADGDGAEGGRRRKWYELSGKGRSRLAAGAKGYRAYVDILRAFLPPGDGGGGLTGTRGGIVEEQP